MTAPAPTRVPEQAPRRRQRPPSEYWDVITASWRRREPVVPPPRQGD